MGNGKDETAMAQLSPVSLLPARERVLTPREARALTVLLVGRIVRSGGGDGLCRIRNMSVDGLAAEVRAPFVVGESITIELRDSRTLRGAVRWSRPGRIGIQFDQPITDIAWILFEHRSALRKPDGAARRSPRLVTDCSADILVDGRHFHGAVTNLSQHGARLMTNAPIELNQLLRVTAAGLPPLRGTVRRLVGDAAGIAFLDPIGFAVLGEWLERPEFRYNRREIP